MNEKDTTPVGIYPQGASPYGCLDMAGNVWEWTSTMWLRNYEDYPNKASNSLDGDDIRSMRGGSFVNDHVDVRCAARFAFDDVGYGGDVDGLIGFRVGWSPGS